MRAEDLENTIKIYKEWINTEPFSPNLLNFLSTSAYNKGELNENRFYDAAMSIYGSLYALLEIVRQYELKNNATEAKRIFDDVNSLLEISAADLKDSSSGNADKTFYDKLYKTINDWIKNDAGKTPQGNTFWEKDTFPFKLLKKVKDEYAKFLEKSDDPSDKNGLLSGYHGLGMSAQDWLDFSCRNAIDGALKSFNDLTRKLGVPEQGKEFGQWLTDMFRMTSDT